MGMDLLARRHKKRIPVLHYNWSGWSELWGLLNKYGVDTSEFSGWNDGNVISAKTCRVVAEMIRLHKAELSQDGCEWIEGHEEGWRAFGKSGGCEQW